MMMAYVATVPFAARRPGISGLGLGQNLAKSTPPPAGYPQTQIYTDPAGNQWQWNGSNWQTPPVNAPLAGQNYTAQQLANIQQYDSPNYTSPTGGTLIGSSPAAPPASVSSAPSTAVTTSAPAATDPLSALLAWLDANSIFSFLPNWGVIAAGIVGGALLWRVAVAR
jgi:hypothetical protein